MIFVVWEIITGVQTILLNDYSEKGDFMDERKKKQEKARLEELAKEV